MNSFQPDGLYATSPVARGWLEAMQFMTTLIIYPEDVFAMRAGDLAVGGVRCMLSRSDIRIDQVSHCLSALVAGASLLRAAQAR